VPVINGTGTDSLAPRGKMKLAAKTLVPVKKLEPALIVPNQCRFFLLTGTEKGISVPVVCLTGTDMSFNIFYEF
jgi:hypothetical protein